MADSGALRSRRSRAHAAGDCSLCRHGPVRRIVALPVLSGAPVVDPRSALERLCARLEAVHEQDPGNALVARELRMALVALTGEDPDAGFDVG